MSDLITYQLKGQLFRKRIDEVEHAINQAERRHRTGSGEFAYHPLGISKDQRAKIKETWPVETVQVLAEIAKEIGENKDQERRAFDIIHVALTQRTKHKEDPTGKMAAATLSFALMRGVAPEFPVTSVVKTGGKTFMFKPVSRPDRLVVDRDKVDNADAYLFALHDVNLRRCWLLGWATSKDMRTSEYGNLITKPDVCRWRNMAYYRPLAELRPMADLMRKMGITQIRDGILFESIPDASDLLVVPRIDIDAILDDSDTKADETFYEIMGMDDPAPGPGSQESKSGAPGPAPAEEDWAF